MVQTLENIDKSKVYVDRIEGLDEVVGDVIGDTLTGAVSTITTSDLTAGKILVSDNNGKVAASNKTISDIGGDSDNLSITKNASNKLQTVGVINQNNTSTALKSWSGTLAQYDTLKNNIRYYAWGDNSYYTTVAPDSIQTSDKLYNSSGVELPYTIDSVLYNSTLNQYEMTIEDSDNLYYELIRNSLTTQYDITDIDNNTLYNITDDMQAVTYEAYSKNETDALLANSISSLLSTLYPIGSIYIGTQSTCPLTTLISGSAWVKVSEGRVLQGSDSGHSAGSTIEAGLPNITGSTGWVTAAGASAVGTGAIYWKSIANQVTSRTSSSNIPDSLAFDASRSSSIYGNSNTVQPPAYVVNIWQRTA